MGSYREYVGRVCGRAVHHADWAGNVGMIVGILLILAGIGGGIAQVLLGGWFSDLVLSWSSPLISALGVLLFTFDVWHEENKKVRQFEERLPLKLAAEVPNANYRRLRLENPNRFDVADAFVKLEDYKCTEQFGNARDFPPAGFKFGWCTYERTDGKIPARESILVDIVAHLETDPLLFHIGPGKTPDVNLGSFPIEYGNYEMKVAIGSGSANIPTGRYSITLEFNDDGYNLSCVQETSS